jgi:glycosyltransferase involved in cell wall biosynthesis
MRIGFVVERPTQFEAPLYRLAASDPTHQLHVFFTGRSPGQAAHDPELGRSVDWGFDVLGGYHHVSVPPGAGRGFWRDQLEANPLDLLVVNGYTRAPYIRAALHARPLSRRIALRVDTVLFGRRPALARRLLVSGALGLLFDRYLATGSLTRRYLSECGVSPARIGLFPYPIDVATFRDAKSDADSRAALRARFGIPADRKVALAVAKLSSREAPWDLLRAAPELRRDVTVLVAGDGPLRVELERFVRESGLDEVVRLAGYVPYPELPRLYRASDVFVHAPREERWGVSVGEALAAGLPVVASSRVGAAHDLLAPGTGSLYEAGRWDELAARVRQALELAPGSVAAAAAKRLADWDLAATWRHLLEAAQ